jgi:hypothetical protein
MRQLLTVPHYRLQRWFWILLILNILFITGSRFLLQPLTSQEIVRFELAKHVNVAEGIVQNWMVDDKFNKAIQSIYVDFLFIVLYTTGLAVACVFLSIQTRHEILKRAGNFFSWLLVIAGICDVIENFAMLKSLHGPISKWNTVLIYDMAATKFSIIILSVLFIGICLIFWLMGKIVGSRTTL